MRYVLCLVDRHWSGVDEDLRRRYETLPQARGLEFSWRLSGPAAVLTAWDDPWGDPLLAREGDWIAVGSVRLDNRSEIERRAEAEGMQYTDLQLVLRLLARAGTRCIRDLLGDFAFVAWQQASRTLIAATDAMGVKKLYYSENGDLLAFSTRAEALALEERYEARYLVELISLCPLTPGLTAYHGVKRLAAGTVAIHTDRAATRDVYWSPEEFEPRRYTLAFERNAPSELRDLLSMSVRQRLTGDGDTWAQLSGGMDSSSIVSTAQWLVSRGVITRGVAGTVTYVDWQGTDSDEREFSSAVAARWKIRNEVIIDPPLWGDGDVPPPQLDQPRDSLVFSPRERRLCTIVRQAGGRVLLAGFGSDELFTGTIIYFADWLAKGRVWPAARGLAHWAARGRVSFWAVAYDNAILPLVPRGFRRPSSYDDGRLLPWIANDAVRRYSLRHRTNAVTGGGGRLGRKYRDTMLQMAAAIRSHLDAGAIGDVLDVRYPFLSRPLVEFALRLPPELCARPHARKWVLREAMRDIVPDIVRHRVGKGGPTDALVRSLSAQRQLLEPLADAPILSELGLVDPTQLRLAFTTAPHDSPGGRNLSADVQRTLMTEAWLQIRSGRWPPVSSLYRSESHKEAPV